MIAGENEEVNEGWNGFSTMLNGVAIHNAFCRNFDIQSKQNSRKRRKQKSIESSSMSDDEARQFFSCFFMLMVLHRIFCECFRMSLSQLAANRQKGEKTQRLLRFVRKLAKTSEAVGR